MNYIVVGTGYTGRRVMRALPAEQTTGLNRSTPDDDGLRVRRVDLDTDPAATTVYPAPLTVLYTIPPSPQSDEDRRLQRLLANLSPSPVRIVYLSTSGVYGDRGGRPTDESVAANPQTNRAKKRLAAETTLRSWCDTQRTDWLILRVPGIYGPDRLGVTRLRDGAALLCDADSGPGNRIHVDDLVRCCVAAMTSAAPSGIYNVGDGDHRSSTAFSRSVARLAGLTPPPEITLAEAERQWRQERLSFLRESRQLDTAKMHDVLGVDLLYSDPDNGIRASLRAQALS